MNRQFNNKIIPKLRFPSFSNDEGWNESFLEDVTLFLKGKGISKSDILTNGQTPCIRYGELYTQYSEIINAPISYTNLHVTDLVISEENDVIIPSSGETREDISRASCVLKKGIALGADLNILRSEINGIFLAYYLTHIKKSAISKLAQGNAVVHLYSSQLKKIKVSFPKLKQEQQKIAACLSSLDDLITAENQKLEILKAHKNGLLQNLFPADGETVPKLRFTNTGYWEEKPLGEIAQNLNSKRIPITENLRIKGNVPYIGASGIIDYVEDYIFDDDLLCISEDGANLLMRTYPIAFSITGKTWVNNHAHVLKFENKYIQTIVENQLNYKNLEDFLTGMAQPKLNRAKLDLIPLQIPVSSEEQQKVANLLTASDSLITLQTQKIESLKNHKKGLLQGLFPDTTEITA